MKIRIVGFAAAREAMGVAGAEVELAEGATVGAALDAAVARWPGLEAMRERLAVAVEMGYVEAGYVLGDGDEVALIPPVSGG